VRIYNCDRCGSTFASSSAFEAQSGSVSIDRGFSVPALPMAIDEKISLAKDVDLCGNCVKGLTKWLLSLKLNGT
jgi:hypothetical protein